MTQATPATNESLTAAALAAAPPEKQKNMIGERLYPLIHDGQPQLAGKITGKWYMRGLFVGNALREDEEVEAISFARD